MSFMQKIREYLDILIENQNMTNDEALKNLASEKDYLLLLKPIIEIFEQNIEIRRFLLTKCSMCAIMKLEMRLRRFWCDIVSILQ